MHGNAMIGIGAIIILGIFAQWLGWRAKLPAILPLLITGLIAGPVTSFINPDHLLGDLLFPMVSISVAVILFEGGLTLKIDKLRGSQGVVQSLLSFGAIITWLGSWAAAYFILGMDVRLAALLGAILVVSGPTVVMPLLNFVRPTPRLRQILQWEGIMVDPIGATLAVLVLGVIVAGNSGVLTVPAMAFGFILTLLVGTLAGLAGAGLILVTFSRGWVPKYLQTAVTLMVVIGVFLLSNTMRAEAGLMAVTVMGIVLANQKRVDVRHIISFKEEIGILLLSVLFIALAARISINDFAGIGWEAMLFLAVLILVVRPIAAFVSTIRSSLNWKERVFLSWMAPRGIVAASVASFFALELSELGIPGAEQLLAITFLVVMGTVTVYALTAAPLARRLGLVEKSPQGTLIIGAHSWARELARAVQQAGIDVWLVDTNAANVRAAKADGIQAIHGSILSEHVLGQLPMPEIGRVLALTPNGELNALASLMLKERLNCTNIFTLTSKADGLSPAQQAFNEQNLFDLNEGYRLLDDQFAKGAQIQAVPVGNAKSEGELRQLFMGDSVPLFLVGEETFEVVGRPETAVIPQPGQHVISLIPGQTGIPAIG